MSRGSSAGTEAQEYSTSVPEPRMVPIQVRLALTRSDCFRQQTMTCEPGPIVDGGITMCVVAWDDGAAVGTAGATLGASAGGTDWCFGMARDVSRGLFSGEAAPIKKVQVRRS